MKRVRLFLLACSLLLLFAQPAAAQTGSSLVLVITVDDAIAPAVREYIQRSIALAERRDAGLLVLQLNTPGGLISTMNDIVQDIRASRVPVVVYISPRGAMAASAGTLITLAGHAAAMAPETIIGAASPVGGQGEDLDETRKAKEMEALTATVRTLTEARGEAATRLAEATILEAKAVSASEALEAGLVDFIAANLDDLLGQLDGYQVKTAAGTLALRTANVRVEEIEATLIEQLLALLTNPNFVFLLLNLGILSIFIELSSPGGWVAGFIGVVCLALAAYGLGVLPVNWFGIVFLIISFVLFILDIKTPTHGALTAAGIGSFIVGALVLFNSPGTPQFQRVSVPLVVTMALLTGAAFAVIVGFAIRALRVPVRMGQEALVAKTGTAATDFGVTGQVQVGAELWSAEAVAGSGKIQKGDRVEVIATEGLRLKVKKVE
jgi:membrane-bound serine protease (ClpP class)